MDRREFIKTSATLISFLSLNSCSRLGVFEEVETGIPDYYFNDDYLTRKVSRINNLIQEEGVIDAFVFITDQHWDYNAQKSPYLMHYIQQKTGIKTVFCGGDVADYYGQNSLDYMSALKSTWEGDIHCVVGNHEYLGRSSTEEKVTQLFNTNPDIQIGNLSRHYYYVDNQNNKIRYIVLSSYSESIDGGQRAHYGFGSDQANWLRKEALSVQEGWKVILFTHFLYYIGAQDDKVYLFDDENKISNIIDNYRLYGRGEVIGLFHGHNHRDRVIRMPLSGIPVIISTCDKNIIEKEDQLNVIRPSGSILEQAFDVVIINEKKRNIHCVRIGCPAKDGIGDEVGNDVEERVIEY